MNELASNVPIGSQAPGETLHDAQILSQPAEIQIKSLGKGAVYARVLRLTEHGRPEAEMLTSHTAIQSHLDRFDDAIQYFTERAQKMDHELKESLEKNVIARLREVKGQLASHVLNYQDLEEVFLSMKEMSELYSRYDFYFDLDCILHSSRNGLQPSKHYRRPEKHFGDLSELVSWLSTEIDRAIEEEWRNTERIQVILGMAIENRIIEGTREQIMEGRSGPTAYYDASEVCFDKVKESLLHSRQEANQKNTSTYIYDKLLSGVNDCRKMRDQIIQYLLGKTEPELDQPVIVVSNTLQLPDLLPFIRAKVLAGFIGELSHTDHAVIVLKRMMPIGSYRDVKTSVREVCEALRDGDMVCLDNEHGVLSVNPTNPKVTGSDVLEPEPRKPFHMIVDTHHQPRFSNEKSAFNLLANLNLINELPEIAGNFYGIGLVRSEIVLALLEGIDTTAEKQEHFFRRIFTTAQSVANYRESAFPLTVRVADYSSSDKRGLSSGTTSEEHVLPGITQRNLELHISSILRASRVNPTTVVPFTLLWPQVESVEKMQAHIDTVREMFPVDQSTREEMDKRIAIGAQIESVEGVFNLRKILSLRDLRNITIGTNDLTASLQEIERGEQEVEQRDLRLIFLLKRIFDIVEYSNKMRSEKQQLSLKVCGDITSDPEYAKILVGIGFRDLSVRPGSERGLLESFSQTSLEECVQYTGALLKRFERLNINPYSKGVEHLDIMRAAFTAD